MFPTCYLQLETVVIHHAALGHDGAVTEDDRDTAVIHRLGGENYRGPDPACKAVENSAQYSAGLKFYLDKVPGVHPCLPDQRGSLSTGSTW